VDVLMLCGARRKVLYVQTGSMPWLTAVGQRDGAKTLALPVYEAICSRSAVVYYRDISGTGIIMPAAESRTDRKGCLLLDFNRQLIQSVGTRLFAMVYGAVTSLYATNRSSQAN